MPTPKKSEANGEKPPKYMPLKMKVNEMLQNSQRNTSGQNSGDLIQSATSGPSRLTTAGKNNASQVHLIPQAPFTSILATHSPSQPQTLMYSKAPQFIPFSVGLSPNNQMSALQNKQGGFNTPFRPKPQTPNNGSAMKPNADIIGYYDNKLLKPLQKERSLLQKLYKESLNSSPSRVPKIMASNFTGDMHASIENNPPPSSALKIGGISTEFGVQSQSSQQRLVNRHNYRLDGRGVDHFGRSSKGMAAVKIPTIDSVRSNVSRSSLESIKKDQKLFA